MSIAPTYQKSSTGRGPSMETRIVATPRGDLAALVVERDDGTCTVLRAGVWRTFHSEPDEWPNREGAMRAVEVAVGELVVWNVMAHTRRQTERRERGGYAGARPSVPR